jgi:HEAT repeat protein
MNRNAPNPFAWIWGFICAGLLLGCLFTFDVFGIRELAGTQASAVSRAIEDLENTEPLMRRSAAWVLGEKEATVALAALHDQLPDADPRVRGAVAWALGEIKDPRSVGPLIDLLDDRDSLVREMAALSLGEIEDPSAVGPLWAKSQADEALADPVIWALGEIGTPDARRARDQILLSRNRWRPWENDEVWKGNLEEIELPRPGDIPRLIDGLRAGDPTIRRQAAQALGCLRADEAAGPLLDAMRDPDASVRARVIWALDEIRLRRAS